MQDFFFRDGYVGAFRDNYFIANNSAVRWVIIFFIFHLSLLAVRVFLVRSVVVLFVHLVDGLSLCISLFLPIHNLVLRHVRSPYARCARHCCPLAGHPLAGRPLAPLALPVFSQITLDAVTPTSGLLVHRALISLHPPISWDVPIAAIGDAAPAVNVNALVPPVLEPEEVVNPSREHRPTGANMPTGKQLRRHVLWQHHKTAPLISLPNRSRRNDAIVPVARCGCFSSTGRRRSCRCIAAAILVGAPGSL